MRTQKMNIADKIKSSYHEITTEDIFIIRKELIIAVYEELASRDQFI